MSEEREEVYQILELGKHLKNLHHKKGYGGLLFIDLSMLKFSILSSYIRQLDKENQELKKQLEYLRSGEYYNQLRFERDMLQYMADNGKVSKEDKEFIDMTHRNTELLEVIEEVRELIPKQLLSNVNITKYTDEMCLRDILQILDKVKN